MAFLFFDAKLDTWGDNALFIILGRSIASGQGMRDISYPGTPVSGYAFGFPVMLAIIEWLSPGNHLAEKLLIVGWYLLAIPLCYLLARDLVGPKPALWSAVLIASSPFMLRWSHQVMTEMPFLSVSLLGLLLLGRATAEGDRLSDPRFIGSLAAILMAMTIRSPGLLLALAALLVVIARRRYRSFAVILVLLIVAITGAVIAGYGAILLGYIPRFVGPPGGTPDSGGVFQNVIGRVQTNVWRQVFVNIPVMILPFPGGWLNPRLLVGLRGLLALVVLSLLVVGLGRMFRRSEPWAVYTGLYLLAVVIWDPQWAVMRTLIPIVPFLCLSIVVGVMPVLAWCQQRWPKGGSWPQSGLVSLVFAIHVWGNIDSAQTFRTYPPQWQSYFEAAAWIEQHTPPNSIIAARKPTLLYLTSKRRSMMPLYSPSPEELLEWLHTSRATHVVIDQLEFPETSQFLVPAIRHYPEIFRPVYATMVHPPTYVLEIRRTETAASSK